jgi:hypothetical protein
MVPLHPRADLQIEPRRGSGVGGYRAFACDPCSPLPAPSEAPKAATCNVRFTEGFQTPAFRTAVRDAGAGV